MIKMYGEKMSGCLEAEKRLRQICRKARWRKQRVMGFLTESPFS